MATGFKGSFATEQLNMGSGSLQDPEDLSFLQGTECRAALDIAGIFMGCICVHWTTDDEVAHTVSILKV